MAVVDMAINSNGLPVSLHKISERQSIALNYLEQIFIKLKKNNIVNSVRGPGGGYVLAMAMEELTLYHVISAVSEPLKMTRCGKETKCRADGAKCSTHKVWADFGKVISNYFSNISLLDVVKTNSVDKVLM
jgi:Rrf2 family transcriptional regulator, iron-sulfur cluster assembly transcription factor